MKRRIDVEKCILRAADALAAVTRSVGSNINTGEPISSIDKRSHRRVAQQQMQTQGATLLATAVCLLDCHRQGQPNKRAAETPWSSLRQRFQLGNALAIGNLDVR